MLDIGYINQNYMAARKNRGTTELPEDWKNRIRASAIANRLFSHFMNEVAMSATQIKAGTALFNKLAPDLSRSELTGRNGGAIETKNITKTDAEILAEYMGKK